MQRSAMSTSNAAVATAAWWQSGWKRAMLRNSGWPWAPLANERIPIRFHRARKRLADAEKGRGQ